MSKMRSFVNIPFNRKSTSDAVPCAYGKSRQIFCKHFNMRVVKKQGGDNHFSPFFKKNRQLCQNKDACFVDIAHRKNFRMDSKTLSDRVLKISLPAEGGSAASEGT